MKLFSKAIASLTMGLAALCIMAASPVQADQAVLLRYVFNAGDVHHFTVKSDETVKQSPPHMGEMTLTKHTEMDFTQEILSVDADGNARTSLRYDAVRLQIETPFGTESFDSSIDSGAYSPETACFEALIGSAFEVVVSPRGKVLAVNGLNELVQRLVDSLAEDYGPMKEVIESTMSQLLSEEAISNQLGKFSPPFPEEAVCVGCEWDDCTELDVGFGAIKLTMVYKLKSVSASEIVISVKGSMSGDLDGTGGFDVPLTYNMNGVMKGDWVLNGTTCMLESSTMNLDMLGQVEIAESDIIPEGMSWDIATSSLTSVCRN
ncbi:MAG: hypothetical protein KDK78_09255 [Chlamydiia bacterium]|nr:hypothetical protein [Chlamydiia bacterium]